MPTTVEPTTTTTARGAANPNPSKSLKRTASMASLPTPPATRTRTRTGKGGSRGSRASGGSPSRSTEDEHEHDSDSDLERASAWSGASRKRRKLALDAIAAELAGTEKEEVAFWLNSAPVPRKSTGKANARPRPIVPGLEDDDDDEGQEDDDDEATARKKPRSTTSTSTHGQAPVSPPPSRRSPRRRVQTQKLTQQPTRTQTPRSKPKSGTRATTPTRTTQLVAPRAPVTPPRTVKTNGRIRKSQGPGPVRDSPNNPFLVDDEDEVSPGGSSWSPAEPKTPPESIEPPTLTYVHRGKKQVHANPHYNPALGGRLAPELPLDHPDFEPSVACAPRLLFPPSRSSARVRGRPTNAQVGQAAPRTPSPSFRDIARAKVFGLDFDEDEECQDVKEKGKGRAKAQGSAENPSPGASTDEELRRAMPRLLRATVKATPAKPKAEREGLFGAVARTRAQRGKAKEES